LGIFVGHLDAPLDKFRFLEAAFIDSTKRDVLE
jgi:hypothetical protein